MTARIRCDEDLVLALVAAGLTDAEVASAIGVTTRTLDRWRAARPGMNDAIKTERRRRAAAALRPCGTEASYHRGCRCEPCTTAASKRHIERARKARNRPVPATAVHGRATTYNWHGCRCEACTRANSDYNRPYSFAYAARKRAARVAS